MTDTRIVYGATCTWWDSIDKVAQTASGLPCCPHCGEVLFEMPDEPTWWASVDAFEGQRSTGYRRFVEWTRGRCFPNYDAARAAHAEADR